MNKKLKQAIHDKWVPKIKQRLELSSINTKCISEEKLKKIAEAAHVRQVFESVNTGGGVATLGSTVGRGAFSLGNNTETGVGGKGSGEVFQTDLFGLFIEAAAITFGMDLLPTKQMSKSNLSIFVAEPVYADGKVDSADKKPLVFQVKILTTGAPTALVVGTVYTVKTANSGGENVMDMTYVGRHRLSGNGVFRVGSQYDNSGGGGTNWNNEILADILDTVSNGSAIYTDASNYFGFSPTTVDYVEGNVNFVSGYTGAGLNDTNAWYMNRNNGKSLAGPMSRHTGETTYYRSMGLRRWHKNFTAETSHVDIEMTTEFMQDMKMDHDIDSQELAGAFIRDALSQAMNDHILSYIFAAGWQNHWNMNQINGFNLNFFLGSSATVGASQSFVDLTNTLRTISGASGVLPASGAIAENLSSLQRRLVTRMLYATGIVNNRSREGRGDTAVLNTKFSTAIRDIRGFTPSPFENDVDTKSLYELGTFYGIKIYEDPVMDLNDGRVSVFRHGGDNDTGLKLLPYILGEKIEVVPEGTMGYKQALKNRYTIAPVGSYPEKNYITFTVEDGGNYGELV